MSNNIQAMLEQLGEDEYLLPIGYKDREGTLHRVARLTPMIGETEENIADPKVRDNPAKLITTLLTDVTESLGGIERVTPEVIRSLTTIDRDYLTVANAITSFGQDITFESPCQDPHCDGINTIEVNLKELQVEYMEEDDSREFVFDLPVGLKQDGKVHKEIVLVLPTGIVQEQVAKLVRVNPAQATSKMFSLITKRIGEITRITPDTFKKLTKKDRDFISHKLTEIKFGVNLKISTVCASCGKSYETSIPLTALLGE